MKVIRLTVPAYTVENEPDSLRIGKFVDDELKKHFLGKHVLVRGLASSEHPDKTPYELVNIIQKTGTDRYDPNRVGDRYDNIDGKHIDLFAFSETITETSEIFKKVVWGFYHSAIAIHGYPMRIDIVTIYDANKMQQVLHQYEGREDIKDDGFMFKEPDNKVDALLGVITL